MADLTPYQILGVTPDMDLKTIKQVYHQLALKHHPDRGGDLETYKKLKTAFISIVNHLKNGVPIMKDSVSTHLELKEASKNHQPIDQQTPQEFFGTGEAIDPNKNFRNEIFNQKFLQTIQDREIPNEDYREKRTREQLLSEQQQVNTEMSQYQPIFNGGQGFDSNTFNRYFTHINGTPEENTKALQYYEEPQALTSGLQPYTEIDDQDKNQQASCTSSLGFCNLTDCVGRQNPTQVDRMILQQLSKQPDITDVKTLEPDYHSKMKQRLNEYQQIPINVYPKPTDSTCLPEPIRPINPSIDKTSQQNLSDSYNRKLQERNSLFHNGPNRSDESMGVCSHTASQFGTNLKMTPQMGGSFSEFEGQSICRGLPVMEYPRNSNASSTPSRNNRSEQLSPFAQIPYQVQEQTQNSVPLSHLPFPPQQTSISRSQPQNKSGRNRRRNNVDQLQRQIHNLQKTVQQQNKMIRDMSVKK